MSAPGTMRLPGPAARAAKGWWRASRWLLLRRVSQLTVLGLFLLGPWFGVWVLKGNLSASLILDTVPMTDLLLFAQNLAAGVIPERSGLLGAGVVAALYLFAGGRAFCAWVCPMNLVTDAASWLRPRLGLRGGTSLSRSTRFWVLGVILLTTAISGQLVWESVNPVALLTRGLLFGMGAGWLLIAGVFLLELLLRHGWCGRLCPTGALYSLLAPAAVVRVAAPRREQCDDCQDCYQVCPEPQVIGPALKGETPGKLPIITGMQCTNCGRCVDLCPQEVFQFVLHPPDRSRGFK